MTFLGKILAKVTQRPQPGTLVRKPNVTCTVLPPPPEQCDGVEFAFSEGDAISIMFALHDANHWAADCFRETLSADMQAYLERIGAWEDEAVKNAIVLTLLERDNPPAILSAKS
jgi:hypothetical protein